MRGGPYLISATIFHGWEGGTGPYDCENLYRLPKDATADPNPLNWQPESYGAYASFDLNDGYAFR